LEAPRHVGQGRGYGLTMSDRPDDPESGAGEPKPPKIKAEDNPWYLLATLYGVPGLRLLFRVKCGRYPCACILDRMRPC
jgi:hypothetical protein